MFPQKLKTIAFFCFLLPVCLAGCRSGNPTIGNAIVPVETSVLLPTQQPSAVPAFSETPPSTPTLLPTSTPSATPADPSTPTPRFIFDTSGYDPDLFQPIEISHNPPLIARADAIVTLVFDLVNTIYCPDSLIPCQLEPSLSFTYGEAEDLQTLPLKPETVNGMESLVARLPATDQAGRSLRYFAEFSVPEAGYIQRYPAAGMIDLVAVSDFVTVDLSAEKGVGPGEQVYDFFWGFGPDKVRSTTFEDYPTRVGPQAIDVADDGRLALLDSVNERIIIFNPDDGSYSSFPLPFAYKYYGQEDLQFDLNGQLVVFDLFGEQVEGAPYSVPQCYRLFSDGSLDASGPVYTRFPLKITKDLQVLDYYDYKLVAPFDSQGSANSREAQREKQTWTLPYRFVEGLDPYVAHFADVKGNVAFEVHSISPLGWIMDFEQVPQGYLLLFGGYEQIRAVWINPSGAVLKDITVPNGHYSELSLNGQVAVAQDGSLYVMSSTGRGIEIHFVGAP